MKHILIILSLLHLSSPLFGQETSVLFQREVNGKFEWFENGDEDKDRKYLGEIKNGKPNGQGTITYPDGFKYLGKYNDGKLKNVWMIFTYPNGRKYVGEWKDGKRNGHGTITTTDGGKFVGEWRENNP